MKLKLIGAVSGFVSTAVYVGLFAWLGIKTVLIGSLVLSISTYVSSYLLLKKSGIEIEWGGVRKVHMNHFGGWYALASFAVGVLVLTILGYKDYAAAIACIVGVSQLVGLFSPVPKGILE